MGRPLKGAIVRENAADTTMRDQEVIRANRELAAYFKGRRTEREARAALKTIKAFIRDREHADPKLRRPLPGAESAATGRAKTRKTEKPHKGVARRRVRHQVRDRSTDRIRRQKDESVSSDAPPRDESS